MSATRIIVKPELFSVLATRAIAIGVSTTTYANMMLTLTLDAPCPVRTAARAAARAAPPANVVSKPAPPVVIPGETYAEGVVRLRARQAAAANVVSKPLTDSPEDLRAALADWDAELAADADD